MGLNNLYDRRYLMGNWWVLIVGAVFIIWFVYWIIAGTNKEFGKAKRQ